MPVNVLAPFVKRRGWQKFVISRRTWHGEERSRSANFVDVYRTWGVLTVWELCGERILVRETKIATRRRFCRGVSPSGTTWITNGSCPTTTTTIIPRNIVSIQQSLVFIRHMAWSFLIHRSCVIWLPFSRKRKKITFIMLFIMLLYSDDYRGSCKKMLGNKKANIVVMRYATFERVTLFFIVVFSISISAVFLFIAQSSEWAMRLTGKVSSTCKLKCVDMRSC